ALSSAAIGLVLGTIGHAIGWPIPKGGSHQITKAMVGYLKSLGGQIEINTKIADLQQLPPSKVILFNNTPEQILNIAGNKVPPSYAKKLRSFTYGPGVFKMD